MKMEGMLCVCVVIRADVIDHSTEKKQQTYKKPTYALHTQVDALSTAAFHTN